MNFTGWHAIGLFAAAQIFSAVVQIYRKPDTLKLRKEVKRAVRAEIINDLQRENISDEKYDL